MLDKSSKTSEMDDALVFACCLETGSSLDWVNFKEEKQKIIGDAKPFWVISSCNK